MKFLLTSDWHLTNQTPRGRRDDYPKTQMNKVSQILVLAKDNQCDGIIVAGDIFDSDRASHSLVTSYIRLFRYHESKVPILGIFGQHDLRYHINRNNSPLAVLSAAGVIDVLEGSSYVLDKHGYPIYLHGVSWNQKIETQHHEEGFDILIIHKMIVDDKLWASQEGHTYATHMVRQTEFDLIVSGDNHQTFVKKKPGDSKYLINPGSLMRSRIDQIDHKPSVFIFDTNKVEYEQIFLEVESIEDVMNLEEAEKQKKIEEKLETFISGLSEVKETDVNFVANLKRFIEENNINPKVEEKIWKAIGKNG